MLQFVRYLIAVISPSDHRTRHIVSALGFVVASMANVAARADVTDVMREIERNGSARVIVTMNTGAGLSGWRGAHSVAQQKAIVASASVQVERDLSAAQIPVIKRFRTLPFTGVSVNHDQLLKLASLPSVASIHLVKIERRAALSGLERPQVALSDSVASIDVPAAWAAGYEGAGLTIAVIDGAFNTGHPMLQGKIVGEACFSDVFGTLTSECPSSANSQIGSGAASNCVSGPECDHATNVASIAVGNDGTNFGVARKANLMPINVMMVDTSATDCGTESVPCYDVTDPIAVLSALDYVNENAGTYNVAAVNISIGGEPMAGYCDDDPRKTVIDALRANGIAVAIAAGNDGLTGEAEEPSCISSSIAVGATDDGTNVATFSNFATTVDVMAPGVNIMAAGGSGSTMVTLSGTSMATPHVAGAWTLLRSAMPSGTADQFESALKAGGVSVTRANAGFGVTRIDVMQAINALNGRNVNLFNQVVSTAGDAIGLAYLRVYNSSATVGTLVATLRDVNAGTVLGTWTSGVIPPNAAAQIPITTIETNAVPATGASAISPTLHNAYNLQIETSFPGYAQSLLWAPTAGVFANMTSCSAGPATTDGTLEINVHAASISGYISHLRITNTGAVAAPAVLTFVNAATGNQVTTWTSPSIAPNASIDVTEPSIESVVPALASATATGVSQYNVTLSSLSGYLQHVIQNTMIGALTDMSEKCTLAASSAVPTPSSSTTASAH